MAKKRKGPSRSALSEASTGWNEKGGKPGPIQTYEDVADSEDEFHINRDKIMLDEGPDVKRKRNWQEEDALLEPSDEEILGYSSESDEEEDDIMETNTKQDIASSERGDEEEEGEEEEIGGWGSSRKEYYNADTIQTEEDARMEEQEARIIQQKRLKRMTDADFGFDDDEWLEKATKGVEDEEETITEDLRDVKITSDMTTQERLQILQVHYPEFEFLADEFVKLQDIFQELQQQLTEESPLSNGTTGTSSVIIAKSRALAAYMASLAMYFATFSSPARYSDSAKPLDPMELHDHPVMDSIMRCREVWTRVKSLKAHTPVEQSSEESTPEPKPTVQLNSLSNDTLTKSKKRTTLEAAAKVAAAKRAAKLEAAEEELADLTNLIPKSRKMSKNHQPVIFHDDDSDFGEETHLSSRAAAEKALKRKSLRFYTSQITQKSNKRAEAGRDAGGDVDVPYKERIKDRQARINAEAEKRGKKLDEYGRGAELGGASDEEDAAVIKEINGEEDEYYDMIAQVNKKRKMDKDEKYNLIKKAKAENSIVRIVEGEVDEDGKRAIGYVIEKNKGLAPKRKKDVRNPRVKKRKKYEEKKKKLESTRAVYKGGEERGGYGGEKTGIKTGLVKSVKL